MTSRYFDSLQGRLSSYSSRVPIRSCTGGARWGYITERDIELGKATVRIVSDKPGSSPAPSAMSRRCLKGRPWRKKDGDRVAISSGTYDTVVAALKASHPRRFSKPGAVCITSRIIVARPHRRSPGRPLALCPSLLCDRTCLRQRPSPACG
jgi:hypothetical protein